MVIFRDNTSLLFSVTGKFGFIKRVANRNLFTIFCRNPDLEKKSRPGKKMRLGKVLNLLKISGTLVMGKVPIIFQQCDFMKWACETTPSLFTTGPD